ncbi:hypothetical protein HDU98_001361 [Podochytrium sp. JEL0797]|nr:hypothetical protein HDU98_001361 [Podochytrium sp. JEL0797]
MYSALYCSLLYRHRKTKPFRDGFVRHENGKATLLDETKTPLGSLLCRTAPQEDDELEFDRFFCVVGSPMASSPMASGPMDSQGGPSRGPMGAPLRVPVAPKPRPILAMSSKFKPPRSILPQKRPVPQPVEIPDEEEDDVDPAAVFGRHVLGHAENKPSKTQAILLDEDSPFEIVSSAVIDLDADNDDDVDFLNPHIEPADQRVEQSIPLRPRPPPQHSSVFTPSFRNPAPARASKWMVDDEPDLDEDESGDFIQQQPRVNPRLSSVPAKASLHNPTSNWMVDDEPDTKVPFQRVEQQSRITPQHSSTFGYPSGNYSHQRATNHNIDNEPALINPPVRNPVPKKTPKFSSFKPPAMTTLPTHQQQQSSVPMNSKRPHPQPPQSLGQPRKPLLKSANQHQLSPPATSNSSSRVYPHQQQRPKPIPPPAPPIPKHSSKDLFFRTSEQCVGLKRLTPTPQFYKTAFQTAILEHIQIQLDTLALRLHQPSPPNSHYSTKKVPVYPATVSTLTRESFQHKTGQPSFMERTGNLVVNLETKMPPYTEVSKDDIWILSSTPTFATSFLATSVYYGVSAATNSVELSPFSDRDLEIRSKMDLTQKAYAIHAVNGMTELLMFRNLERLGVEPVGGGAEDEGVMGEQIELVHELLGVPVKKTGVDVVVVADAGVDSPRELEFAEITQLRRDVTQEFHLNEDQSIVLERVVASVFHKSHGGASVSVSGAPKGFQLVHGVFGSGKTFLIAVLCLFFERAVEKGLFSGVENFRIAISSMSNGL